ncbi:transposase, partial [Myxococcota bacterium]
DKFTWPERLLAIRAQKPIPMGGITGDGIHIWDADLRVIDEILKGEELIDILWRSFCRGAARSPSRGRERMALNRVLRTGVLKHIKNWSFRELFKEMQRNLDYRSFTQVFEEKLRSVSAFSRNIARVDAQALRELNERLCALARQWNVVEGRLYRQDTTVCETNIHYPTDSSLLQDGVRVVQRLVTQAGDAVHSLARMRDRSKAIRNRVLEIARAARGRGEDAKKRREKSYRSLLRIVRPVSPRPAMSRRSSGMDASPVI